MIRALAALILWMAPAASWSGEALETKAQLRKLSARQGGEAWSFAVLGDSRQELRTALKPFYPDNGVFARLLDRIEAQPTDFIMHLGDMVKTGKAEEYRELEEFLVGAKLKAPFLNAIGNHEVKAPLGLENYRRVVGPEYYFFDRKGFRFIVIDSSRRRVSAEQREWLEDALNTKLRKIVFSHMPPMPLQAWTDSRAAAAMARRINRILRDDGTLAELFRRSGVERFYAGHIHAFGQADYRGVRYVLSGGAGSPMYPWYFAKHQFYHYLRVSVAPGEELREEVCREDGSCRPISDYQVFPESLFVK